MAEAMGVLEHVALNVERLENLTLNLSVEVPKIVLSTGEADELVEVIADAARRSVQETLARQMHARGNGAEAD
jgi:hypothetical protein